jgi:peptide/nickel transport system substrate-binding protein
VKKLFIIIGLSILIFSLLIIGCSQSTSPTAKPAATSPSPTTSPQSAFQTVRPVGTPQSSPATSPTPSATLQPVYGGVFRGIQNTSAMNMGGDPAVNPSPPTYFIPSGESLFFCDPQGNMTPRLATSWEFSPDMKIVTFSLRKGVKFQDGTDFNAQAVKFCLDRGIKGAAPGLKAVSSVDVVDDYTVRVTWPKFDISVLNTLGCLKSPSRIVSPAALNSHDATWALTNTVATGAFKLTSYTKDVAAVYDKFEGYWQKGLPYLDRVQMDIITDPSTALMSFRSGAEQYITNLAIRDAIALKSEAKYNILQTPGFSIYLEPSGQNQNSPFKDVNIRRAVSYALDSKALADGFGKGYYLPSNQNFPPWSWAYNPNVKGYPYDPAKAKQLLLAAGYPAGFKTKLYYTQGYPTDLFVELQANLKAVGIDVDLTPLSATVIADMTTKSGWDGLLYYQQNSLVGTDPGSDLQNNAFVNRNVYQISVFRSEDVITALEQANSFIEIDKRKGGLQQVSKMIIDDYCMICPIYCTQTLTALAPNVHDMGVDQFALTYDKAWLSK